MLYMNKSDWNCAGWWWCWCWWYCVYWFVFFFRLLAIIMRSFRWIFVYCLLHANGANTMQLRNKTTTTFTTTILHYISICASAYVYIFMEILWQMTFFLVCFVAFCWNYSIWFILRVQPCFCAVFDQRVCEFSSTATMQWIKLFESEKKNPAVYAVHEKHLICRTKSTTKRQCNRLQAVSCDLKRRKKNV